MNVRLLYERLRVGQYHGLLAWYCLVGAIRAVFRPETPYPNSIPVCTHHVDKLIITTDQCNREFRVYVMCGNCGQLVKSASKRIF